MENRVVNRISELSRPSPEFPRSFMPNEIDFSDWKNLEPMFKQLLERKLDSKEALEQWLLDNSELGSVISEEGSRRYIAMTCATDDEEAEKAYLHFVENIEPRIKPFDHKLNLKLLDCKYLNELDEVRFKVLIRDNRNYVELFREENIALDVEIAKLSQEYQKTIGAMTVTFQDKEYTLPQMGIFLQDKEREVRRESWQLTTDRRLKDAEKLDDLFDKMLKLRVQVAKNAGFDDFRAYQFRHFGRFDYTPEDCFSFHKAVEKYVVPLTRQMNEERRKALSLGTVRPWDTACDRLGREPLRPFEASDKLVSGCREIFSNVNAELGDNFQKMIDLGLLDLDSRKGKAPGGYQSSLSEIRLPFIFMNAVGLNRDVFTLLHEGGHAFHQFAVHNESILDYRHAPMEFCEVASMSMELLGSPYLDTFYSPGDAARTRREHFEGSISILSWIAIIDAFQHWIYTNPDHSVEQRCDQFVSLMDRFGSGVDWSGLDDAIRYRWQAQLHIFEYPFYYIEYGIAQLGALQVWQNSRKNLDNTIKAYKSALRLGGSRPLPDLFKAAEIEFKFTDDIIEPLMAEVGEEIKRQGEKESR